MKIEAFKLFEALNSSCIKKREVYKNKILSIFILYYVCMWLCLLPSHTTPKY